MAPQPRLVLLLHSSAGHYGADRQLELIARGLDPERYRPLVVLANDGPLAADLRDAGVEVAVASLAVLRRELLSPLGVARLAGRWARDARALGALARRRQVALVHSNTSVILGGAPAARLAGVPHVWHVREIYGGFRRLWPIYRRLLSSADELVCVSRATAAQFAGASARVRVTYDGMALAPAPDARRAARESARRHLGLPGSAFVCAVLGRLSAWKGQDVLLRALAAPELQAAGAVGLIAGDPWPSQEHHRARLRELASDLGVAQRVRWLGFCPEPELLYAAADVVAVPSTEPDPLPNAALEAAAAGCCVVASGHGGLPEIVRDGHSGRLIPPGDARALARVLAELAADPAQAARLGAAAAEDARARFDPRALLRSLQEVYDRAVSR
ncbi:MAG: glycosyltransferase [Actinobacteria bacterium]|nr:MAG: glycosyltransferase [Actinomycetota bacterium]